MDQKWEKEFFSESDEMEAIGEIKGRKKSLTNCGNETSRAFYFVTSD